jgi:hypothetical protein
MPFPMIFGTPESAPVELVREIRAKIIDILAKTTGLPHEIITPFFPSDRAGDPDPGQSKTIYCRIDSGMFGDKPANIRHRATFAIREVIWRALMGEYEVEVVIGDFNPLGKSLRHPALKKIDIVGEVYEVQYQSTDDDIAPGVLCDVYSVVRDATWDIGMITIDPSCKTRRQKVLQGTSTVERYFSGKGKLIVTRASSGNTETYNVGDYSVGLAVEVNVGDVMQWEADPDRKLVVCEVCYPPYADGRFENLD